MTAHLLDTSALLAHLGDEPGAREVDAILKEGTARIASPTRLEFMIRVVASGASEGEAAGLLAGYAVALAGVAPVDARAADAAWKLRRAATKRIPAVDALIAGCAASIGATLVHRDPHFISIPSGLLPQIVLPGTLPATGV